MPSSICLVVTRSNKVSTISEAPPPVTSPELLQPHAAVRLQPGMTAVTEIVQSLRIGHLVLRLVVSSLIRKGCRAAAGSERVSCFRAAPADTNASDNCV